MFTQVKFMNILNLESEGKLYYKLTIHVRNNHEDGKKIASSSENDLGWKRTINILQMCNKSVKITWKM